MLSGIGKVLGKFVAGAGLAVGGLRCRRRSRCRGCGRNTRRGPAIDRGTARLGRRQPDVLVAPVGRGHVHRDGRLGLRGNLRGVGCVGALGRARPCRHCPGIRRRRRGPSALIGGVAEVAGGFVMHVVGWLSPVPHGEHDVALDAGGARRGFRVGALGDAIGPVGEHGALVAQARGIGRSCWRPWGRRRCGGPRRRGSS